MNREFSYYRSFYSHRRAIMTLAGWMGRDPQWLMNSIYRLRMNRLSAQIEKKAA